MQCKKFVFSVPDLLRLAKTHSCVRLVHACYSLLAQKFQAITHTEAFLELTAEELVNVLKKDLNPGDLLETTYFSFHTEYRKHYTSIENIFVEFRCMHVYARAGCESPPHSPEGTQL